MFEPQLKEYNSENIQAIRKDIYHGPGFYIIPNFIEKSLAKAMAARWFSGRYNFYFSDYIANKDIRPDSPNYLIERPTPDDWGFVNHIWNRPVDDITYDAVAEAHRLRNLVEGNALQYGLASYDDHILQYRICRTVSDGQAVKPHADFMEEYRHDPLGDHGFAPHRCQLTLFLSDYGSDYQDGGFKFITNDDQKILFGRDEAVNSGDLIIWKYSNVHEVSSVRCINPDLGFARIIFPSIDREVLYADP